MIDVRDLKKEYHDAESPTQALRGVTFTIDKGEFVSIMGPSGSGKSTLLHILSFLDRPSGGIYTFQGKSIDDMTDLELAHVRNKDMGFVFQSFNLLSRLTVYENVEIPLLYSSVPPAQRKEFIEDAVTAVGLADKLHTEAGKLSGGQKQRVAIARALVVGPNVIFADEPTGNLDSKSGLQVMEILDGLHKRGRTIILVTHETQTAEFANRIIRLKDGVVESDKKITARRSVDGDLK
ncbi:MAG: ABC transporter ATP-binding protein [Patescibacteria group bacterium]|nr:ABC transporter ATP-binding protein [Patescibacteria group bacterium]